ncbi:MAG: sensor histidine kinase [Acidobacteria bacterium]|nr:sensor histidine kinase [Acidobacteriota bacterium]
MRFRTWPVAALGLGGLLVLVFVSVLTTSRKAQEIYTQLDQLDTHHRNVDAKLRRLRADVHLSGIFVRDYLLDSEKQKAPEFLEELNEFRSKTLATASELATLARGDDEPNDEPFLSLQEKLEEYWQAFEPLFDWTPAEKQNLSAVFLRRQVLPRREAVLDIASQIEKLNNANLEAQRVEVDRRYAAFRNDLNRLLWRTLLLGLVVAIVAVFRLRVLERRSETQREVAEDAERLMRHLSQQLVATQEDERKKLSRELHDHVGQLLTALRLELGRIDRLREAGDKALAGAVGECRQLVDNLVRVVRDLALGLRPTMLDDFGLQPALEWLVRDVSRRSLISVDLTVHGSIDELDEQVRTCVYRAVQEALTNAVRHAHAETIEIAIAGTPTALTVSIVDDGAGFDPSARQHGGLGLRGIEERVKELHGTVTVHSARDAGTTVKLSLPIRPIVTEERLARAAG